MKRPLFLLLIGLVLGELCGYWLYLTGVMIWASLLCLVLLCCRMSRKGKLFFVKNKCNRMEYYFITAFVSMALLGNLSWYMEGEKIDIDKAFAHKAIWKEYTLEGKLMDRKITDTACGENTDDPHPAGSKMMKRHKNLVISLFSLHLAVHLCYTQKQYERRRPY